MESKYKLLQALAVYHFSESWVEVGTISTETLKEACVLIVIIYFKNDMSNAAVKAPHSDLYAVKLKAFQYGFYLRNSLIYVWITLTNNFYYKIKTIGFSCFFLTT